MFKKFLTTSLMNRVVDKVNTQVLSSETMRAVEAVTALFDAQYGAGARKEIAMPVESNVGSSLLYIGGLNSLTEDTDFDTDFLTPSEVAEINDEIDQKAARQDAHIEINNLNHDIKYAPKDNSQSPVQLERVAAVVKNNGWLTLAQISAITGDPEASVSARLRELRTWKGGALNIVKRKADKHTYEYRAK